MIELGRLLELLALRVDIGDAGRALAGAVEVDLDHLALGACSVKLCLRISTGRIVVCGLALE